MSAAPAHRTDSPLASAYEEAHILLRSWLLTFLRMFSQMGWNLSGTMLGRTLWSVAPGFLVPDELSLQREW